MFSHCRMSAGREIQVEQQQPVRCVCEERPAAEHRKSAEPDMVLCMGLYQLAEIRSVAVFRTLWAVHIIHDIWIATRVQCYKERVTRMIIADLMLMYQRYRRRRESCRQVLCKFYIGRHKRRLVRQWKSGADAGARRDMIGHVVPVFCLAFLCTKMTQYHADMHENAPRAWNFKKKSVMIPRAWSINARGAKTQICSNPNVVYKFIIIIIYFVKRWTLRHARLVYCDTVCTVTIGFLHYIL